LCREACVVAEMVRRVSWRWRTLVRGGAVVVGARLLECVRWIVTGLSRMVRQLRVHVGKYLLSC